MNSAKLTIAITPFNREPHSPPVLDPRKRPLRTSTSKTSRFTLLPVHAWLMIFTLLVVPPAFSQLQGSSLASVYGVSARGLNYDGSTGEVDSPNNSGPIGANGGASFTGYYGSSSASALVNFGAVSPSSHLQTSAIAGYNTDASAQASWKDSINFKFTTDGTVDPSTLLLTFSIDFQTSGQGTYGTFVPGETGVNLRSSGVFSLQRHFSSTLFLQTLPGGRKEYSGLVSYYVYLASDASVYGYNYDIPSNFGQIKVLPFDPGTDITLLSTATTLDAVTADASVPGVEIESVIGASGFDYINLIGIPEPSAWIFIAGSGAMWLFGRRRLLGS